MTKVNKKMTTGISSGSGGAVVSEKPSNGEIYERILMIGEHVLEHNIYQATTPEQRLKGAINSELNWRNSELDFIDSKNYAADFPYLSEVQTYKQNLRDYDYNEGLAENRPSRPVTVKGSQIITGDT